MVRSFIKRLGVLSPQSVEVVVTNTADGCAALSLLL
jgi:hypothetical protein